jgi:hypothetical protein
MKMIKILVDVLVKSIYCCQHCAFALPFLDSWTFWMDPVCKYSLRPLLPLAGKCTTFPALKGAQAFFTSSLGFSEVCMCVGVYVHSPTPMLTIHFGN